MGGLYKSTRHTGGMLKHVNPHRKSPLTWATLRNRPWQWKIMEHPPFTNIFSIKTCLYRGFTIAMFHYRDIHSYIYIYIRLNPYYIPMMVKYGWHIPVVFHDIPIEFNISQPAIFDYRRIIPLITIDHHQSSLITMKKRRKKNIDQH